MLLAALLLCLALCLPGCAAADVLVELGMNTILTLEEKNGSLTYTKDGVTTSYSGTLTLKAAADYGQYRVDVKSGAHSVILDSVRIRTNYYDYETAAISISSGAALKLYLKGANTLGSYTGSAISVPEGATLEIYCSSQLTDSSHVCNAGCPTLSAEALDKNLSTVIGGPRGSKTINADGTTEHSSASAGTIRIHGGVIYVAKNNPEHIPLVGIGSGMLQVIDYVNGEMFGGGILPKVTREYESPGEIVIDGGIVTIGKTKDASEYYPEGVSIGGSADMGKITFGENAVVLSAPNGFQAKEIIKALASVIRHPVAAEPIYTGEPLNLFSDGGAAKGGTMVYSMERDGAYSAAIPTATDAGTYKVWYKVKGDLTHSDTDPMNTFPSIGKAQAAVVTAPTGYTLTYTGASQALVTAGEAEGGTMRYSTEKDGVYDSEVPQAASAGDYTIWYRVWGDKNHKDTEPQSVAAAIIKEQAKVVTAPTANAQTYTGSPVALLTAGEAEGGTMVYSMAQHGTYSPDIPMGEAADTYTVWYKAEGDAMHADSEPQSIEVTIAPAALQAEWAQLSDAEMTYTGAALEPGVTVTFGGRELVPGTDYTVGYQDNVSAGAAKAVITGMGNFTGTAALPFTILPADITTAAVILDRDVFTYTGNAVEPTVLVQLGGFGALTAGTDYTVSFVNNVNAGKATVIVTGAGSFTGAASADFIIQPKALEDAMIDEIPPLTYTGEAITPAPQVHYNSRELFEGVDFEYAYESNIHAGENTAAVIITAVEGGNFYGSARRPFTIRRADAELGAKLDREGGAYVYGEEIVVTMKPEAAKTDGAGLYARSGYYNAPEPDMASLYVYDVDDVGNPIKRHIIESVAKDPETGVYTLTYDTTKKELPIGSHTLITMFAGSGDLLFAEKEFEITISPKPLTVESISAQDRVYEPGNDRVDVTSVVLSGIEGSDNVAPDEQGVTAQLASDAAGSYVAAKLGALSLMGPNAAYYSVAGPQEGQGETPVIPAVQIIPKALTAPTVELSQTAFIYSGAEQKPGVTVRDGRTELTEGVDYQITWPEDCTSGGTKTVQISFIGNYSGEAAAEYTITPSDSSLAITLNQPDGVYTFGETIIVTVHAQVAERAASLFRRAQTAGDDTMALYYGDTLVSDIGIGDGEYAASIDTAAAAALTEDILIGSVTFTARFSGSGSLNGSEQDFTVTILPTALTPISAEATSRYYAAGDSTVEVTVLMLAGYADGCEDAQPALPLTGDVGSDAAGAYDMLTLGSVPLAGRYAPYYTVDTPADVPADVEIWGAPVIDGEDMRQVSVTAGETLQLSVNAEGREIAYAWYVVGEDGTPVRLSDNDRCTGTDTDTLTIAGVPLDMDGLVFRCEASNGAGSDTVRFALTVVPEQTATPEPTATPMPTATPEPTPEPRDDLPQTGDASSLALWAAMLMLCGAGALAMRRRDEA